MNDKENPYTPPLTSDVQKDDGDAVRGLRSWSLNNGVSVRGQRSLSIKFALSGLVGGFVLGSLGYLLLIGLIETFLTPPFVSPPNYGQFSSILADVTLYMSILGILLGLVPFVPWRVFFCINFVAVFSIVLLHYRFFFVVNWLDAPVAAMMFLFMLPSIAAIIADRWLRPKPQSR